MKITSRVLIALFLVSLFGSCKLNYPPGNIDYQSNDESIAEGKRMTMMICGPCHYNPSSMDLSGRRLHDAPGIVGKIYASNITQHMESGIGKYSQGEIQYLIRTGVSRTGKLLPFMQRPNLSDGDLRNLIAFLKSDDALVKPNERVPGKTDYTIVGKLAVGMAEALPYLAKEIPKPQQEQLEIGRYLIDNLACFHCHSKSFMSLNINNPEKSKGYMGGGKKMRAARGKVKPPNLTFHETGIKNWTLAEFKRALREGIDNEGKIIAYPMPMFPELTDQEILSMFAYLKSLPPIKNDIK